MGETLAYRAAVGVVTTLALAAPFRVEIVADFLPLINGDAAAVGVRVVAAISLLRSVVARGFCQLWTKGREVGDTCAVRTGVGLLVSEYVAE